jgi:hypothetical protein
MKINKRVSVPVTDLLYRKTVTVKNTPLEVEILDVSGKTVRWYFHKPLKKLSIKRIQ